MKPVPALTLTVALAAVVSSSSGCATIVNPGPDVVAMTSTPSGARVSVDGSPVGTTPVSPAVARKAKAVAFAKEGYGEAVLPVPRHFNGWVLGNALIGGLIGLIIDASTGNAQQAEDVLHVDLHPVAPATAAAPATSPGSGSVLAEAGPAS